MLEAAGTATAATVAASGDSPAVFSHGVPKPKHIRIPPLTRGEKAHENRPRCESIELILSDVDGVLTDGGILFDNQGIESKQFHIRDGMGIRLWQRAGYKFGLITGRSSHIVKMRAAELNIEIVRQTAEDKLPATLEVLRELGLEPRQACYIGDDLPDLPAVRAMGLGVAVADACAELKAAAHYRDHAARRAGGGARDDRNDSQIAAPLGRFDSKIPLLTRPTD